MHSSVIAEPVAHICGLTAGFAAYAVAGHVTQDVQTRIRIGMIASSLCNAIIGGHINYLAKDFLSLIILRPISVYGGAKLFEVIAESMAANK